MPVVFRWINATDNRDGLRTLIDMHDDEDETKITRTLSPDDFEPISRLLEFDWRVTVSNDQKAEVIEKVIAILDREKRLADEAKIAVISRRGLSADDTTLWIDLVNDSAERLGTIRVLDDGRGRAYLA